MRKLYLTIIASLFIAAVYGQETKTDSAVAGLKVFLSRSTRPVAIAVENNVQGIVVVGFKIDDNKNIVDVHVIRSLSREFDAEVLRVFKAYHQSVSLPPAEYTAGVGLVIDNKEPKKPIEPIDKSLYQNYLFDVNVMVHRNN